MEENACEKKGKKYVETPLMKQYYAVKAVHSDAVLLFRVGDNRNKGRSCFSHDILLFSSNGLQIVCIAGKPQSC